MIEHARWNRLLLTKDKIPAFIFRVTVLGVSAKSLAVMEEKEMKPKSSHDLHTLRTILSTGSPLAPHQYDFVYNNIKSNVLLASITGIDDEVNL